MSIGERVSEEVVKQWLHEESLLSSEEILVGKLFEEKIFGVLYIFANFLKLK